MIKMKPLYRVDGYGCEIHEMTEMAQVNLGQCAISNQPSFNIPYLFAVLGEKEKSEELIKYICENLFTIDAYPGDEDNGSMSAWYILSVLGKYKTCPGKAEWTELTPLTKFKINI
jgi:putative alpha-1,2-mannosidase